MRGRCIVTNIYVMLSDNGQQVEDHVAIFSGLLVLLGPFHRPQEHPVFQK